MKPTEIKKETKTRVKKGENKKKEDIPSEIVEEEKVGWTIPIVYDSSQTITPLKENDKEYIRRKQIITEFYQNPKHGCNEDTLNLFNLVFLQRKNIFLTGVAGTGKSYQLKLLFTCSNEILKSRNSSMLCSSTGSSALNIGIPEATTLHSWSGLMIEDRLQRPTNGNEVDWCEDEVQNYCKSIGRKIAYTELLFVDEISMIGSFYLKTMDAMCKYVKNSKQPMGGIQVVFIGDMLQLPPVKDKHAFYYQVWNHLQIHTYRLTKVYRQESKIWSDLLNKIRVANVFKRDGKLFTTMDTHGLKLLKDRCSPNRESVPTHCLWLYSRRSDANTHNHKCLSEITGAILYTHTSKDEIYVERKNKRILDQHVNSQSTEIKTVAEWEPLDELDEKRLSPKEKKLIQKDVGKVLKEVDQDFLFKVGARVMCKKNLYKQGGLVNGSRGIITDIKENDGIITSIRVKFSRYDSDIHDGCTEVNFDNPTSEISDSDYIHLKDGSVIAISTDEAWFSPYRFENTEYITDDLRIIRTRIQFPFMLAFAITVHQSQGLTLDDVVIDLNNCFAPGQAYVAMSRCKSLERMHLLNFKPSYIYSDRVAVKFDSQQ